MRLACRSGELGSLGERDSFSILKSQGRFRRVRPDGCSRGEAGLGRVRSTPGRGCSRSACGVCSGTARASDLECPSLTCTRSGLARNDGDDSRPNGNRGLACSPALSSTDPFLARATGPLCRATLQNRPNRAHPRRRASVRPAKSSFSRSSSPRLGPSRRSSPSPSSSCRPASQSSQPYGPRTPQW